VRCIYAFKTVISSEITDKVIGFFKSKLVVVSDFTLKKTNLTYIIWGSAFIPNILMNLIKNGRLQKDDAHAKEVWEKHGKHDTYMTMDEIKSLLKNIYQ